MAMPNRMRYSFSPVNCVGLGFFHSSSCLLPMPMIAERFGSQCMSKPTIPRATTAFSPGQHFKHFNLMHYFVCWLIRWVVFLQWLELECKQILCLIPVFGVCVSERFIRIGLGPPMQSVIWCQLCTLRWRFITLSYAKNGHGFFVAVSLRCLPIFCSCGIFWCRICAQSRCSWTEPCLYMLYTILLNPCM